MKDFIKNRLNQYLLENKKKEYEYQLRDIGGSDVYYKRKKNTKVWDFIDKKDFEKNSTKENTIKFKT